jgi:hypothetical protein
MFWSRSFLLLRSVPFGRRAAAEKTAIIRIWVEILYRYSCSTADRRTHPADRQTTSRRFCCCCCCAIRIARRYPLLLQLNLVSVAMNLDNARLTAASATMGPVMWAQSCRPICRRLGQLGAICLGLVLLQFIDLEENGLQEKNM